MSLGSFFESLILHSLEDYPAPVAEEAPGLPGHEIPEEIDIAHGRFRPGQMPQAGKPFEWIGAEQLSLVPMELISHDEGRHRPRCGNGRQSEPGGLECPFHTPPSHLPSTRQGLRNGGAIHILQIATHGDAPSQSGDPGPQRSQCILKVHCRGLSLH